MKNMYDKNSQGDLLTAAVTAGLGAGVVTSFAVSQGQNPLIALGITGFSVVAALLFDSLMR
jgi:energy-converting hydrogenase Eha subunit G